ncbi:MAG: nucleoside phosphorylase, partial [Promethearchaeota archaeon]
MHFPNFPDKHKEEALITPKRNMVYRKARGRYPNFTPPQGVIIVYQRALLNYIITNYPVNQTDGFLGNFYLLEDTNNQVGVCGNFGFGSPIISLLVEDLFVFGVRRFLSIGTAGSLQRSLQLGSIVVCDRAIRDEGTSHHYLPSEKYAYPSPLLQQRIVAAINDLGLDYVTGPTWTIDAPYRETVAEVSHYREEGVLTVEMEAAALFAIAQYHNFEAGAIF